CPGRRCRATMTLRTLSCYAVQPDGMSVRRQTHSRPVLVNGRLRLRRVRGGAGLPVLSHAKGGIMSQGSVDTRATREIRHLTRWLTTAAVWFVLSICLTLSFGRLDARQALATQA